MHIDLCSIHDRILEYLKNPSRGEEEKRMLERIDHHIKNHVVAFSPSTQEDIFQQIHTLQDNVAQLSDDSLLHFFLLETQPLMDRYRELMAKPVVIDFMKCAPDLVSCRVHEERQAVTSKYLSFIHKHFATFPFIRNIYGPELHVLYCNGDTSSSPRRESSSSSSLSDYPTHNRHLHGCPDEPLKCPGCSNASDFSSFDNQIVCDSCAVVMDQYNQQQSILSFKDIDRVNMNNKYSYDRKTHFRDCIYQFQGKQNVRIHEDVYKDILEQLVAHSLIPANYTDLPKEMAFEQVTKEHVFLFLKQTSHVKHYEDVTLIYHVLTGKPVPDISHLEKQLISDFDLLVEQYDKQYKHHTDRKNFINTQYILFQLLNRHHYPCSTEDFNMLKTIDRRYYHDEKCSALFDELGWTHRPVF